MPKVSGYGRSVDWDRDVVARLVFAAGAAVFAWGLARAVAAAPNDDVPYMVAGLVAAGLSGAYLLRGLKIGPGLELSVASIVLAAVLIAAVALGAASVGT